MQAIHGTENAGFHTSVLVDLLNLHNTTEEAAKKPAILLAIPLATLLMRVKQTVIAYAAQHHCGVCGLKVVSPLINIT
jgi:hypothetical protein